LISARAGHSPEPGSSARAALASEASGQRGHFISARAGGYANFTAITPRRVRARRDTHLRAL
jgi:hypothetical protein